MNKNHPHSTLYLNIGFSFLAMLGETILTMMLYLEKVYFSGFIIGHAAVVSLILAVLLWFYAEHQDIRDIALLALFTALLGIFGSCICFMHNLLFLFYHKYATPFKEWYDSLFPEHKNTASTILYERLLLGKDDFSEKNEVIPFMDIIALGTTQQKRKALEKILRYFTPEFAPALLMATKAPENSIRVQAASILAKLETNFSQAMYSLQKKLKNHPEQPALMLQLAKHYDAYANAGFITDPQHKESLQTSAIEMYERYIRINSFDHHAIFYLARLYMQTGRSEDAYHLLKICMEEANPSPRVIWYSMECLFNLHRLNEIKAIAQKYFPSLDPDNPESFELLEMVKLWGGGIAPVARTEKVFYET